VTLSSIFSDEINSHSWLWGESSSIFQKEHVYTYSTVHTSIHRIKQNNIFTKDHVNITLLDSHTACSFGFQTLSLSLVSLSSLSSCYGLDDFTPCFDPNYRMFYCFTSAQNLKYMCGNFLFLY
jgi:hypothetical protein